MEKYDLIPNFRELEFLFVMESPHTEELKMNLPCVGESGRRMAQNIFGEGDPPFGKRLNSQSFEYSKYGIINSFNFPLGITEHLSDEEKKFCVLKRAEDQINRKKYYEWYNQQLESIVDSSILDSFRSRLESCITKAPNLQFIIFCGFISQAMYLYCYDIKKIPPYLSRFSLVICEKKLSSIFVNHPRNDPWHFRVNFLDKR